MKKKYCLGLIIALCLLLPGCRNTDADSIPVVEALPIEVDSESRQVQETYEKYEEIEVEVNGNKGTITVGTIGAPFTELLTQAKIQLAKEGWDLQIKYYDDYEKINKDVLENSIDAHFFSHQTYVDSYNDVNGTNLTAVAPICYEVYGVYSALNDDLTKISGATIGVPQDATDKARVLLFMNDLHWIVLKEGVGMTAIMDDMAENTKNLTFVEYTEDSVLQVASEVDYCIIGADMAIAAGFDIEEDIIYAETNNSAGATLFSSLLVTTEEKMEEPKLKMLVDALTSGDTMEYAAKTYKGALGFFE